MFGVSFKQMGVMLVLALVAMFIANKVPKVKSIVGG